MPAPVLPNTLRLEAMAACQLRCRSCPTADGSIRPVIKAGYLRAAALEELLESNPQLRRIELSNYGEIFLNPQLLDVLRVADERGVELTADNGANLNDVEPEVLEGLVKYRLRRMSCSIDGASQATYAQYRVRGNFDVVLNNVRTIVDFKKKYRSPFPILTWQFIVFGHNEHELPAARALAESLGMRFKPKISWDDDVSPIKDRAFVMREAGIHATREEHQRELQVDYSRRACHQLWNDPQLNWDGTVLGCCRNFWGDFGANAFNDGLGRALNAPRITHARAMLMGQAPPRDDVPCTSCDVYKSMRATQDFITEEELAPKPALTLLTRLADEHPSTYRALRRVYRATGARRVVGRLLTR